MNSTLTQRLKKTASTEALGEEALIPFKELREQYGANVAKQMRHQKQQLQSRAKPGDEPYILDHPDLPGNEAPHHPKP